MHGVWTVLLALAYPAVYVVPTSVIRLTLAGEDENIAAQQLARATYVVGLVAASNVGMRGGTSPPAGWSFLERMVSLPGGIVDVLWFGVMPIVCLFAGSIVAKELPTWRSREEVLRDLVASPVLEELVFRGLLLRWLVVSRGVESVPSLVILSPAVRAGTLGAKSVCGPCSSYSTSALAALVTLFFRYFRWLMRTIC